MGCKQACGIRIGHARSNESPQVRLVGAGIDVPFALTGLIVAVKVRLRLLAIQTTAGKGTQRMWCTREYSGARRGLTSARKRNEICTPMRVAEHAHVCGSARPCVWQRTPMCVAAHAHVCGRARPCVWQSTLFSADLNFSEKGGWWVGVGGGGGGWIRKKKNKKGV